MGNYQSMKTACKKGRNFTMAWKLKTICAAILSVVGLNPVVYAQNSINATVLSGNHNGWLLQNSSNLGQADSGKLMDLSIILKARMNSNRQSLSDFARSVSDPSSPNYRHFATSATFMQDFSPTSNEVGEVKQFLVDNGFTIKNIFSNNLVIQAEAPIGVVEKTFNVTINQYQHGNKAFFANSQDPQVPSDIGSLIMAIAGMTTFSSFVNNTVNSSNYESAANETPPPPVDVSDQHGGVYGPQKVQDFYNINPLYKQGNGKGTTLAIATLANFRPEDASYFWKYYGVHHSGSVSIIPVDGGFDPTIPAPGADETALDVEQSGALAPGANIEVYEAPNTSPGFLDLFYRVAADNTADTMSVSWGEDEKYETPAYHAAMDQAFLEGAAEGISMFAAAGDNGAYDSGSQQLGVDSPASDPFITAAGGTIYPGMAYHKSGTEIIAEVPQESVWGWDWTLPYYADFGFNNENQWKQQAFPTGGGGGISNQWNLPWYQKGVPGVNSTGRNVPDISLNADPFAGYALYDSFSGGPYGSGWSFGWGGTSFVSPQLNGITALMDSIIGGRLGFLNPAMYHLASQGNAYGQGDSPFNDITTGDNWYYDAAKGYDDGSGIGSLNVANLEAAISQRNG
jgi:kumamolisin